MCPRYVKPHRIELKGHDVYRERWVQDLISNDPSILGLGDLVLRDRERRQPRAGRLDLLLQDPETQRRYEVELQLGSTDEAHIIPTIEYWDIERKRYPQYDHCAVLVAEDITSRFLNVVSLFNGTMPLIAVQMRALQASDYLTLVFTTVLDEFSRGLVDEDEDAEAAPTDRVYWEKQASPETVGLADRVLKVLHGFDPTLNLKCNKFYIGLEKDGQPFNFVLFKPKKSHTNIEVKLPRSDEVDAEIDNADLVTLEYNRQWGCYRIRLSANDIETKSKTLEHLSRMAYERRISG